ncbi:hypothetical protein JXB37_05240, partial [candidate division WOR-3 bacterium]|nr:hypothetical protein [candidate division WOR-3 bacterium]
MNRFTVLLAACLFLGLAAPAGAVDIISVLEVERDETFVDSVAVFNIARVVVPTPGFGGDTGTVDTANLGFHGWPEGVVMYWRFRGREQEPFRVDRPVSDTWYYFPVFLDDDIPRIKFINQGAIEELPGNGPCRLAAEPSLFSARTALSVRLDRPGRVVVEICDATGRPVRRLADARLEPGVHRWTWDATDDSG